MKRRTIKQRKIAEAVLNGASTKEIAKVAGITGKYVSQSVYNHVNQKGTQAEIAQIVDESNVLSFVTVERIIHNIQSLAFDVTLKPKEREGYLRMLAEYKALLKQVNLNETVTSSDALVEQAEQALATLKHDTIEYVSAANDASVASIDQEQVVGETKATGSGKEPELHPGTVSEKE